MNNKRKIIDKVRKCLKLAKSSNEHEAATALRQAKKLMDEHGIDVNEAERPEFAVFDLGSDKSRKSNYSQIEFRLYNMVCYFFGCSMYVANTWPIIVGINPAPEIARYASEVLLRQLRKNRKTALEALRTEVGGYLPLDMTREFNHSYTKAWIISVDRKIHEFARKVTQEEHNQHSIVIKEYFGLQGEIKERVYRSRKETEISTIASHMGREDGQKAELNHGVGSEAEKTRMLS